MASMRSAEDVTGAASWRVLPLARDEPGALLAASERLLTALADDATPTLRWYRATSAAIVVGRGQPRRPGAGLAGVPVVGRSSGGGAVLMDSDLLALDVAVPAGHPLADGDIGAVFIRLGQAWAQALGAFGLRGLAVHHGPAMARPRGRPQERLLAAVCYATLGRGEVTAGGRKLVGLAQRRRRQGALVQCGLLRRWQPARLLEWLGADPDDPAVTAAAVGLDDLLTEPAADADIMAAVNARICRAGNER